MRTLNDFITALQRVADNGLGEAPVEFTGAYGASERLESIPDSELIGVITKRHRYDFGALVPRIEINTGIMTG